MRRDFWDFIEEKAKEVDKRNGAIESYPKDSENLV